MKVLLVVRWPVGGIRTFIHYVYSTWNDPNLELTILTPNITEVDYLESALSNIKCKFIRTNNRDPNILEFSKLVSSTIRQNNYDLIHCHGFIAAICTGWRIAFKNYRSLFTSHDTLREDQFVGIKGKFQKLIIEWSLNRFSVIQSVSYGAEKNLLDVLSGIDSNKSCVIRNGIDTNRFFNSDIFNIREYYKLRSDQIIIGFFGRFMPQKGFKYLRESLAILEAEYPDRFIVVCFSGGGFFREEIETTDSMGLSKKILFHDFVPDTSSYIKGCDLVVIPSLWEACCLIVMEVLSAGVKVVASDCIGLGELCQGSPAEMVSPEDSEALADAIKVIIDKNRNDFLAYSKVATEIFSVDKTRESYQNLYRDLVN